MALIIVEGCDFTGKSTLVQKLQKEFNLFSIKSPRPHDIQECRDNLTRIQRMAEGSNIICDRIGIISEPIYGPICRKTLPFPPWAETERLLQEISPIIIWCRPPWEHVKTCDNAQMDGVKENLEHLFRAYENRMNSMAMFGICQILLYDFTQENEYDNLKMSLNSILSNQSGYLAVEDREMNGIDTFHHKFLLNKDYNTLPSLLNPEMLEFRHKFLAEEVQEFKEAHDEGSVVKAFDALIDIVYVAKGSALLMGITSIEWAAAFDIVQHANMQKIRAPSASLSKRNSSKDVIKPDDWEIHKPEPKLEQLLFPK